MKVILKEDVKGLGKKGATVEVADGYGRNFLLPRGLALEASAGALRSLAQEQKVQQARLQREINAAQDLRNRLHEAAVTIKARAGEGGRLFGSVTNKDVADAMRQQFDVTVDKKKIELKETVKSLGTFVASVRLGHELVAEVQVRIVEA